MSVQRLFITQNKTCMRFMFLSAHRRHRQCCDLSVLVSLLQHHQCLELLVSLPLISGEFRWKCSLYLVYLDVDVVCLCGAVSVAVVPVSGEQ